MLTVLCMACVGPAAGTAGHQCPERSREVCMQRSLWNCGTSKQRIHGAHENVPNWHRAQDDNIPVLPTILTAVRNPLRNGACAA